MNAVTLPPIRYVFVCATCSRLACSDRRDRLTCSSACRVQGHRRGDVQGMRELAKAHHVPVGMIVRSQAVMALRPDLADRISKGELDLSDVEADVWAAYCARVEKQFPEEWQEYRRNGWKL